jgi:hypothetical protein
MQINISRRWQFAAIICLAVILRVLFLDQAPNTFSTDEASNGYDAYSLMLTMRDRYGDRLPLFLTALNDARESLFVFLMIPFIQVLGLNEFSCRLPAAIAGILNVVAVYYLAKEAFKKENIALLAMLIFAISPWSIYFNRICFRANLLPLFFTVAVWLFLKSFKQPVYLILSSFCFGLSLHTYSSARAFVPLFVLGLTIIYWRRLWQIKTITAISFIVFAACFLFLLQFWISPEGMVRAEETGLETNIFLIIFNYLSYYNPIYLFLYGDFNPRRSLGNVGIGQLYLWESVTVVSGIYYLWKSQKKEYWWLLLWLILYPIPAALTEPVHAIRSIAGIPVFALISAYGLTKIIEFTIPSERQARQQKAGLIIIVSFVFFLGAYFNYSQYKIASAIKHWQYGIGQAINYAETNRYDQVYISNKFKRPNIYLLFYTKYPPAKYQLSPDDPDLQYFTEDYTLGKYTVTDVERAKQIDSKTLFIVKANQAETVLNLYPHSQQKQVLQTLDGSKKIISIEVKLVANFQSSTPLLARIRGHYQSR